MHVELGGYHVRDLEFVAAFDVDASKVGNDLGKAIDGGQNNTIKFADVASLGVDGPARPDPGRAQQVLPRHDRGVARRAGRRRPGAARREAPRCSSPTCRSAPKRPSASTPRPPSTPASPSSTPFRSSSPRTRCGPRSSATPGVPIIGDDIKSQVGATIVHRVLTRLFEDRGLALDHTYQLNVGGNMDFKNMLERERLESKKISKTQAVTSQLELTTLGPDDVHIGPSDHVPWLQDRKWAYIRMEGRNFGDVPLNVELKLEVWDSPNSAGVIIDAVRCAKLALDRGIGGPLIGPSAYFMKSPPVQYHDDVAHQHGRGLRRRPARTRLARGLTAPPGPRPPAQELSRASHQSRDDERPPPRRGGPRPSGARAGSPAPRPPDGPGRCRAGSMTCAPSRSGRMASSSSWARSSAMRSSSSSMRLARARALLALRVVQSQRVSSLSRSRCAPASRT